MKVTIHENDGTEAEYAGTPMGEQLRGPALAKVVVIHAADHYQAVSSLAELDPGLTDRTNLLAWSSNNQPQSVAQGPLRLVVPGEKRQSRWVRQVTAIEVVSVSRTAITNTATIPLPPPLASVEKK